MQNINRQNSSELKRDVGAWGSFAMGYADVGADIYIALGVIAAYAGVASPLALIVAAVTYVSTGLCYAELASAYPVAGGGQYYSMKAFGGVHGFIAGWGLMLDYTIDIALFALATVGYFAFIVRILINDSTLFNPPFYQISAIIMILALLALNLIGIKYSSRFNELIVAMGVATIAIFIILGVPYLIASGAIYNWLNELYSSISNGIFGVPEQGWGSFIYAVSLAMVSYIGIESISQAAEETKYPATVIPKATKRAIIVVVLTAVTLSLLAVTIVPWYSIANNSQAPAVIIARALPYIGPFFYIWVSIIAALTCYVSTNTGIIGVSRVSFSMGRLGLLPRSFGKVSARFKTPYITITTFTLIASLILILNIALTGPELLNLIASLYNFGALVAYMYVNAAAIMLRFKEPARKSWKMPLNIHVRTKSGIYDVSLIPFIGFISSVVVWMIIVGTHPLGRIVGSIWFAIGILAYLIHKRMGGRGNEGVKEHRMVTK